MYLYELYTRNLIDKHSKGLWYPSQRENIVVVVTEYIYNNNMEINQNTMIQAISLRDLGFRGEIMIHNTLIYI